ncbi:MAG: hypothetical protein ACKO0W_00165 [Planctomycetota bacterium]
MPNGGVPITMILRPRRGGVVVIGHSGVVSVYARAEWEAAGSRATPIFRLTEAEGRVLASHIEHWVGGASNGSEGGDGARDRVDVEYDL